MGNDGYLWVRAGRNIRENDCSQDGSHTNADFTANTFLARALRFSTAKKQTADVGVLQQFTSLAGNGD